MKMQGLTVVEDFLPLKLGSTDVILRMQWLRSLGNMEVNWMLLVMKFKMGDMVMTLRGDPSLCMSGVSLKSLMRVVQHQGPSLMVELCCIKAKSKGKQQDTELSSLVQGLIERHPKVF